MRQYLWGVLALVTACSSTEPVARPGAKGNRADAKVVEGVYAIDWKDDLNQQQIAEEANKVGIKADLNSVASSSEELTVAKSASWTDELLARLRGDPLVELVAFDHVLSPWRNLPQKRCGVDWPDKAGRRHSPSGSGRAPAPPYPRPHNSAEGYPVKAMLTCGQTNH